MRQGRIVVGTILFLVLLAMANYAIADNGVIGGNYTRVIQPGAGIVKGVNSTGGIGTILKGITPVSTLVHKVNCAECLSDCEKAGTPKEACGYACIQKFPKDSSCGLILKYKNCGDCLKSCPTNEPLRTACIGSCTAQYDSCDLSQLTCGRCLASCEKQTGSLKETCNYACYMKFPKDSSCGIENKYPNCEDCLNSCPASEPLRSGCLRSCMAQYDSCDIAKLTCNSCLEGCKKISDLKGKQFCQQDCKSLYQKDSKCEVRACEACQNDCLTRPQNERGACYEVCNKISSVCGYYPGCSGCWVICQLTKQYGSLNPVDPIDCVKRCDSGPFCDDATCSQCNDKCSRYFGSSDLDRCLNMCKTDHADCGQSSSSEPTTEPTTNSIDYGSVQINTQKTGLGSDVDTATLNSGRVVSGQNNIDQGNVNTGGFTTGGVGLSSGDRVVPGNPDSGSNGVVQINLPVNVNGGSTGSSSIAGLAKPGGSSSGDISGVFRPSFMSNSTLNKSTTNKTGKNVTLVVKTVNVTLNVTKK